jgi:NADH-quinone oxidoreductase subunit G
MTLKNILIKKRVRGDKVAVIIIDGKKHEVDGNKNLLEVCLSLGYNLPYFCWHPAMNSVGACRQCAVIKYKDEKDEKGKLVMACMEPASDGSIISLENPEAKGFRAEIIEWMMTNHPHDCPVCDEGGECHLQDMTVMTGHNYRRFRFNKRTYNNQYLGPFINHEMNRCIQCYRCVRFYRDYADGRDLDAFAAHNHVFFGRQKDGILENEFSGNLVEVCPTGVFTDKTLKHHYTRKWDLTTAPSICVHCSVGCNTIAGERYGSLRRILSRYNSQVNGYFLCDRGRFGYEYVNSDKRIKSASVKNESKRENVDLENAIRHVRELISETKTVIGIGSPRTSIEANYLLKKFVGEDNFYSGISSEEYRLLKIQLEIMKSGAFHSPSLKDIENSDAILILGEDVTNTAPMLALAVRQAVKKAPPGLLEKLKIPVWQDAAVREIRQDEKRPLFIAATYPTKLNDAATASLNLAPVDIARIGNAVAAGFDKSLKAPDDLTATQREFVQNASDALSKADRPLIITGPGTLTEDVIYSAINAANGLEKKNKNLSLSFIFPEVNSLGLMLLGGRDFESLRERTEDEFTIINLKNDLLKKINRSFLDNLLNSKKLVSIDCLNNQTTENSDVVIPAGTFAESDGSFINNEGRAQRYYQVYSTDNKEMMESWRIVNKLFADSDMEENKSFDDVIAEIAASVPELKEINSIAPPPGFRIMGQKIPREQSRFSGRTAMHADRNVSEQKPPDDLDSPLTFTMEGYRGQPPSSIIPYFRSPGWNSVQSINKYQIEVGGPLHGGDPGRRLFEKDTSAVLKYFDIQNKKFSRKENEYLTIPVYHIFGSEELSSEAPAIKELIPGQYIWMNPDDASKLGIKKDEIIEVKADDESFSFPVKIKLNLPEGLVGISLIKNGKKVKFNQWVSVKKNK